MSDSLAVMAEQVRRADIEIGVLRTEIARLQRELATAEAPINMVLQCPRCGLQHVDAPDDKGWTNPPHKSHLCHGCGCVWRPADVATNGVESTETRGSRDNWDGKFNVATELLTKLVPPESEEP